MNTVVEIVTTCAVPPMLGILLNDIGVAPRPWTAGTDTVQATDWVCPLVRVVTTLVVAVAPAATVELDGLHASV